MLTRLPITSRYHQIRHCGDDLLPGGIERFERWRIRDVEVSCN
jgi:hypothetical protein